MAVTESPVVIVAGPDEHGVGEELSALGATVSRIEAVVSTTTLVPNSSSGTCFAR